MKIIKELKGTEMDRICILHLSDLHMCKSDFSDIEYIIKKIIDDIVTIEHEEGLKVSCICFTGDLIQRGDKAYDSEKQIELAYDHFISPLLNVLKLQERDFFIVPGNHEVDITKIEDIEINRYMHSMLLCLAWGYKENY